MHESTRKRLAEMKERRKGRTYKVSRVPRVEAAKNFRGITLRSKVGSYLAGSIKWITGVKGDKSCGCANIASQMNKRGPDWCEENSEYIVGKMLSNSGKLAEAVGVPLEMLETAAGKLFLQSGAKVLLWNAIRADRANTKRVEDSREKKAKEKQTKQVRKAAHKFRRSAVRTGPAVEKITLPADVKRNLIYHIFPAKKERWLWQWNLDQILERVELFNGRKVVGIVHDENTDSPDAVKEYLAGHGFDYIVEPNVKRLGENVTAVKLMDAVRSFEPEVTFRAHAKGVSKSFYMTGGSYHKGKQGLEFKSGEAVQDWTKLMYATCLDYWDLIKGALESRAMCGPFRRHSRMSRANWYYSGSFYWYEHTRFYQRDWQGLDDKRYGVESLPGTMFDTKEVACVFGNDCPSLYPRRIMDANILPQFHEWEKCNVPNRVLTPGKLTGPRQFAKLSGTLEQMAGYAEARPSDINEHVHALRSLAQRCEHVTEFGVRCGVSTVALLSGKPKTLRSYDLNGPPNLNTLYSIVPPGTNWRFNTADTLEISIDPTDFLFIDTLHEYSQLSQELKLHGNKARKYIAFHDTVTFGIDGELGGHGLNRAIEEFQAENPHWVTMADFKNCNGLRVLRREN